MHKLTLNVQLVSNVEWKQMDKLMLPADFSFCLTWSVMMASFYGTQCTWNKCTVDDRGTSCYQSQRSTESDVMIGVICVCVCVCVCACPCSNIKTTWAINTKLCTHILYCRILTCSDVEVKRLKVKVMCTAALSWSWVLVCHRSWSWRLLSCFYHCV